MNVNSKDALSTLAKGFTLCLISCVVAKKYFNDYFLLAAAALISIGLASELSQYLEDNRREIWEESISPYYSNTKLAKRLTLIFLGVLLAGAANFAFVEHVPLRYELLKDRYQNELGPLIQHNSTVLLVSFLFAAIYRAGGLVLILSWNALNWASSFTSYFKFFAETKNVGTSFLLVLGLLPHLLIEVVSYVFAGMAGIFISKALLKYEIGNHKFHRVFIASITILAISLFILVLSCIVEVFLGQTIFHYAIQ